MAEEEREDGGRSEDEDDKTQHPEDRDTHSSLPPSGARTLGGGPAPPADRTSSSARPKSTSTRNAPRNTNRRFATLGDLNRDQGHSHRSGHAHDDDDDDPDYEDDGAQDFFAGGEKSGLAVQNPGDPRRQVRDILEKAKRYVPMSVYSPFDVPITDCMKKQYQTRRRIAYQAEFALHRHRPDTGR